MEPGREAFVWFGYRLFYAVSWNRQIKAITSFIYITCRPTRNWYSNNSAYFSHPVIHHICSPTVFYYYYYFVIRCDVRPFARSGCHQYGEQPPTMIIIFFEKKTIQIVKTIIRLCPIHFWNKPKALNNLTDSVTILPMEIMGEIDKRFKSRRQQKSIKTLVSLFENRLSVYREIVR